MSRGTLYIVTAPSGCGKGTLLNGADKRHGLVYSVSATTRQPREGEIDGVHYYFKSREEFEEMIKADDFLEYAEYCGNLYGTPRSAVEKLISEGKNVLFEVEVEGAMNLIKKLPEAVTIFILPPSVKELKRRLLKRGTEPVEKVDQRVKRAKSEIPYAKYFDFVIVNDDLDDALKDFDACIIAAKRARKYHCKDIDNKILEVLENE